MTAQRLEALLEGELAGARVLALCADARARGALHASLRAGGLARRDLELRTVAGYASTLLDAEGERFRSGRLFGATATRLLVQVALEQTPTPSYPASARDAARFGDDVARTLAELGTLDETERARLASAATPHLRDLLAIDARARTLLARSGAFDLATLARRATRALEQDGAARRTLRASFDAVVLYGLEDFDVPALALGAACAGHAGAAYAFEEPAAALATAGDGARGRALLQRVRERARTVAATGAGGTTSAIVETLKARAPDDEAAAIAERIERALDDGVPAQRIGVVLRDPDAYGPLLVRALREREIACASLPREDARDDASLAFLRAAFALFERPGDAVRWAHVLGAPVAGGDPLRVRLELAREAPAGFAATLERLTAAAGAHVRRPLLAAEEAWRAGALGNAARILVRETLLAAAVRADDERAAAAVARLRNFVELLDDAQLALRAAGADAACAAVMRRLDAQAGTVANELAGEAVGRGVALLDPRSSKFATLDLRFVAGAAEGRFPREASVSPLFDPADRAALASAGIELAVARDANAADPREARLWYVAAERGRARTIASYAVSDSEGRPARPSRAIPFALLPPADAAPYARPYAPPSGARSDAGTPATLELGRLLDARAAAAFERATPRPIVRAAELAITAVDTWLLCPRRFYFERIAGVAGDGAFAMRFGSALHGVLQRFHAEETDFCHVSDDDAARWTARLHELLDEALPALEPEGPTFAAYGAHVLRRMLADYARVLLADARERPFTVAACEREVVVTLGRARLKGRIDRLDRLADGTFVVRDYKSGVKRAGLAKNLVDAVRTVSAGDLLEGAAPDYFSLQLALYRLAIPGVSRLHAYYFGGEDMQRDRIVDDVVALDAASDAHIELLAHYVRDRFAEPLARGALTHLPTTANAHPCRTCAYRRTCGGAGSAP